MKKTRRIETMFEILRIVVAMGIAYILAMLVLFLISEEPLEAIRNFAMGPLSTKRRFSSMLELMIPFMFTGTCMCMMYSANRFNLVGDGGISLFRMYHNLYVICSGASGAFGHNVSPGADCHWRSDRRGHCRCAGCGQGKAGGQ